MDINSDAFLERLKATIKLAGGTSKSANILSVSESTIRNWMRGDTEPQRSHILIICESAGVDPLWLLIGKKQGDAESGAYSETPMSKPLDLKDKTDYSQIPLYDVSAAAGHGNLVEDERVIDSLAFKKEWIRNELHASPDDLCLIYVDGESMEPTLRPGDVILVNHTDTTGRRDGIYVLRMDDALLVKRLQRMPGGVLQVTSDNLAYDPFKISLDNLGDLSIIGRVVWAGRRL